MGDGSPDYSSKAAVPNLWIEYEGTATTVKATVTFAGTSASLYIENTGDTNNLLYSLDGGTTWATLVPGQNKGVDVAQAYALVKSGASTTTYSIEVTYG